MDRFELSSVIVPYRLSITSIPGHPQKVQLSPHLCDRTSTVHAVNYSATRDTVRFVTSEGIEPSYRRSNELWLT